MQRITAVLTAASFLAVMSLSGTGCYNSYMVEQGEFKKLESKPDDKESVTVTESKGRAVVVSDTTGIYVRGLSGRRYPVTPFNFKMSKRQLVASDRDTLLMLNEIQSYEVDHLSTGKTIGMLGLGAAAAAGVIVTIIVTAGTKTYGSN